MKSPKSLKPPKKLRLFAVRRVVGSSMEPALKPGQIVIVLRRKFKPGDIVMVRHNGLQKIKRVHKIADGQVYVLGDNPQYSTDSRQFGWLPVSHVQGRVVQKRSSRAISKQQ